MLSEDRSDATRILRFPAPRPEMAKLLVAVAFASLVVALCAEAPAVAGLRGLQGALDLRCMVAGSMPSALRSRPPCSHYQDEDPHSDPERDPDLDADSVADGDAH